MSAATKAHPNKILEHLHKIHLKDLLKPHEPLTVNVNDTVDQLVKILGEKNIHSCPVLEKEKGKCVGIIDMLDIMKHLLSVLPDTDKDKVDESAFESSSRALGWMEVGKIMNKSDMDLFVPLEEDHPVTLALDFFATGIHRSPMLNRKEELVSTFSQTDIINWLCNELTTYLKHYEPLNKKVSDLGLGQTGVISVNQETSLLDTIKLLLMKKVSAVALTDKEGKLVGNFSAVDLKGLCQEGMKTFGPATQMNIFEYLAKYAPTSLNKDSLPKDCELKYVVNFFLNHKYHRVYLVENGKPVGLISYTDIMKFCRDYVDF